MRRRLCDHQHSRDTGQCPHPQRVPGAGLANAWPSFSPVQSSPGGGDLSPRVGPACIRLSQAVLSPVPWAAELCVQPCKSVAPPDPGDPGRPPGLLAVGPVLAFGPSARLSIRQCVFHQTFPEGPVSPGPGRTAAS